jgi:hypothetical protein
MPHTNPEKDKKYRKEYLSRPEVKARRKQWSREYNQRPEVKAKLKSPRNKAKKSARQSIYVRIPEVKAKRAQSNLDRLRATYGWSPEAFKSALDKQKNSCAICLEPFQETPHADHEHSDPPRPRGLLCGGCNAGLGLFKENSERLLHAVAYLDTWIKQ